MRPGSGGHPLPGTPGLAGKFALGPGGAGLLAWPGLDVSGLDVLPLDVPELDGAVLAWPGPDVVALDGAALAWPGLDVLGLDVLGGGVGRKGRRPHPRPPRPERKPTPRDGGSVVNDTPPPPRPPPSRGAGG